MPRPASPLDLSSGPAPATPPAPAAVAEWVVERWVDPDWYAVQQSDDPCPSPGLPAVIPLTEKSLLIGRPSRSRGISPEVDCGDDTGVSRRQAQLTTDGQRWWVEDLQSSNGTYVASAAGPLPETPIIPGQRQELNADDRIYVGAWTRLVVRKATPEELAGQA
ncbi:FHA domain-containing protein [Kribbella sp. NPDC004875]|uniref:FHA domain-containing protein n=1 Tax=Kribbella sp. NPDC004875 TaxID=3364107 RepID=UPI0036A9CDA5